MHILHISNSYGGTAVYEHLYTELDKLGIRQTVYVPLNYKNHSRVGNQMIDFQTQGSRIIYSTILKPWHRLMYKAKIHRIVEDLKNAVNLKDVDLIHASTQCLDGAVAHEIYRKTGIPYMVAIRNTDVNNYYKVFFWHKSYFSKILLKAEKIIFISPKYKEHFLSSVLSPKVAAQVEKKMQVLPNGIDDFFLQNQQHEPKVLKPEVQMLFVSAFKTGKGLIETIKAIDVLRDSGLNISLRAIGRGLPNRGNDAAYVQTVEDLAKDRDWVHLEDFKRPKELLEPMRGADIFVMPSKPETFGLVYVEALSQNLPIVYASGQGFDGFYEDGKVGYPAVAGDVKDIAHKIKLLIENYQQISQNISQIDLNETFCWTMIAKKYQHIYKSIVS